MSTIYYYHDGLSFRVEDDNWTVDGVTLNVELELEEGPVADAIAFLQKAEAELDDVSVAAATYEEYGTNYSRAMVYGRRKPTEDEMEKVLECKQERDNKATAESKREEDLVAYLRVKRPELFS